MRKLFILIFFTIVSVAVAKTDDGRQVSLLTCSPGEQVYELFGHTALRVIDRDKNTDIVFNYGLFSFNEPNFIWRFVLGETDYLLGVSRFEDFMSQYAIRGSGVTEQVLNLDSLQKQHIIEALLTNIKVQNRRYRYNFLFNNCTTKARDKVFESIESVSQIVYDKESLGNTLTFRDIVHRHTSANPWYELGMDILLGAPADVKAQRDGAQFAPLILKDDLSQAFIANDTMRLPLVSVESELLFPQPHDVPLNNFTPFNAALLLLLFTFVVMLCERRSKRTYLFWDFLLMGLQGVAGLILLFMVMFSQHPAVDVNWLLIWLNPLPLMLLPFLVVRVRKGRALSFMWIEVAMVLAFFVAAPFLPQVFPAPLYICAVAILVRSLFHIYKNKICALD